MSIIKNLNPVFIEKTKDGERMYDVSSRLIKDRVIYLDCEINDEIASQIVALLFLLDRESSEKIISLWISSPGGCVSGLFAIYDMMNRIKAPIKTVCIGEVCSAASIILASGSIGKRFAMPNSRIMIHQIQVEGIGGSNTELEISAKEIKSIQDYLTEILARHTGHTKAKIKRDTKLDKFMSAKEAKEYGIIDHILPFSKPQLPLLTKEVSIKAEEQINKEIDE
jgi:ATP-dependent Clp protease protease subunit